MGTVLLTGDFGEGQVPPQGHGYQTLARQDWQAYRDKTDLPGFTVEGRLHDCEWARDKTACDPHLPKEDFYDLVPDPLFGQVVRYNGDPRLNTFRRNMPGRVAVHGVRFSPVTNLWVRQYLRFSPNWSTRSRTGGQGAADYKAMFLRYHSSGARHQVKIGDGGRRISHGGGNPGLTIITSGTLPIHNVQTVNERCNTSGWPSPDAWPMILAPSSPGNPRCLPVGSGNGEWYEFVIHHKTMAERGEFAVYWRQYTVAGAVNPQPWKISAWYAVASPGQVWRPVVRYEMGVNRNRQWDEVMYQYWGPYEIVDGSRYPNPWGVPDS